MALENANLMNEKILIEPCKELKTSGGIVMPPQNTDPKAEKIIINCGNVVKVGNGYPIYSNNAGSSEKFWENTNKTIVSFAPLQIKEKDFVYYIANQAVEIYYEQKKYIIIPEYFVLLYERNVKHEIDRLIRGDK